MKTGDTKGTFHVKMSTIKDKNGMDITEAEDIKKRWQQYTEELNKKDQAPPSMGFSKQEYWSGVPLPSPIHNNLPQRTQTLCFCSVAQSCPTLCDPMDCSMPGFPVLHHLLELTQTDVH